MSPRIPLSAITAFVLLTLLSGAAAAGWMRHGEAIFFHMAESMSLTCL